MPTSRNITAAIYSGDNSTQKFYGVGLVNINTNYSIVTIDGIRQIPGSDYKIDSDFGIIFTSPPGLKKQIVIYALETSSASINVQEQDNISYIQRTQYIADGTTKQFLIGNIPPKQDNCFVVVIML